jgi:broad specificity phosphatase PhoE
MAVKVIWSTEVQAGKVSDAHSAFETAKTLAKEDGIDMTVGQEILGGDRVFYLFGEYESLSDYESKMKEAEKNKGWEEWAKSMVDIAVENSGDTTVVEMM